MTTKQLRDEVATHLASAAHSGWGDGLTIDESYADPKGDDGRFEVSGTTDDDINFTAIVQVLYVQIN